MNSEQYTLLNEDPSGWMYIDSVASTNSYLMENDLPPGTVLRAGQQTAGRGRRGKSWVSPAENFIFSGIIETVYMPNISLFSLLSAAALKAAIDDLLAQVLTPDIRKRILVKWPNDLLLFDREDYYKIAGILVESKIIGEKIKIVIGIGLNWKNVPAAAEQSAYKPGSLFSEAEAKCFSGPDQLTPLLISNFNRRGREFLQFGNRSFLEEVREHSFLRGAELYTKNGSLQILGLADDGALICDQGRFYDFDPEWVISTYHQKITEN